MCVMQREAHSHIQPCRDLGLDLFLKHIAKHPALQHKTLGGLLSLIERDRYVAWVLAK